MTLDFLKFLFVCLSGSISICGGVNNPQPLSFNKRNRRETADRFISKMEHKGYDVGEGVLKILTRKYCAVKITIGEGCSGANPSTSYGAYVMPTIEGEYFDNSPEHRIRGDEAIVFIGRTPPDSAYYGYSYYLMHQMSNSTASDGIESVDIYGSLSDTLNPMNIKLKRPIHGSIEDSFDKDVVIVATPHRDVFGVIEKALIEEGVPSDIINLQVISPELFRWGLGEGSDTLLFLTRVAFFKNKTEGDAYINDPPAIILRVTPKEEMIVTHPFEKPVRAKRSMDTNERYLQETLDALENSILKTYSPYIVKPKSLNVVEEQVFGEECILNGENCFGDNSDANYFSVDAPFPLNDDQFYVVAGVNHMRSNTRAKFSSVTLMSRSKEAGIKDFNSINDMDGSAHLYLDEHYEHREYLYVATARRNCTGYDYCMEIGNGTIGLPEEEPPLFVFRSYLHENGTVASPMESLLTDRVYFVDPSLDANAPVFKATRLGNSMHRVESSIQ